MTTIQLTKSDSEAIFLHGCRSVLLLSTHKLQPREVFTLLTTKQPSKGDFPLFLTCTLINTRTYALPTVNGYRFLLDFQLNGVNIQAPKS